ncbi:MAG: polysaccharide biosynthesis/export family protein, partial [Dysgonamonadaceae bacterium]|nr:polysaccharide biosynthesis/export family protein [Dysgonamonadaceae bacterium]
INVLTQNPAIMAQFNSVNLDRGSIQTTSLELLGYLVDEKGEINFPVVGKIMVAGFTKSEIVNMIQEKLAKYIEEPVVVNLRLINYKVTVLGEVNRPGNFTITDEKVSIPEALALAGDLTIYGDRHQVLLMRTDNGQKEFYTLDLTNPAIVFSPLYFLKQNDILYISPNKAKAGNATYSQAVPMIISLVGVALTITSIIINVSK